MIGASSHASATRSSRGRLVRAAMVVAATAAALLSTGCMKAKEMSGIRSHIDEMRQDVAAVQSKLVAETDVNTGGGNFNEPVTGWILAAGYASVPATILLYLLAHRFRIFRRVKDCIRGKPD